jgi:hypothetical protein
VSIPLAQIEEITGASGVAPRIEARLPAGVRHRQLRVRTLLAGMMLTQAAHRPKPRPSTQQTSPSMITSARAARMSDPNVNMAPGQT